MLRTWRLGESDRIVNLMTERHGKVRAVVKGVRKTKSRFGARLEPMVHCLPAVLRGARARHRHPGRGGRACSGRCGRTCRRLAKASSLLEATDQLAQERHANPRLFAMLLGGLRALAAHDSPLLVPAFFLKLLSTEGFHPLLDECVVVRGPVRAGRLRPGPGRSPVPLVRRPGRLRGGCPPRAWTWSAASWAATSSGALGVPAGPVVTEVERLATRAMEHHLERRLRSLPVAGALAAE